MSTVTTSSAVEFSAVLGHHVYAGTDTPALSERDAFIFAQLTEDWDQVGPVPADDRGIDLGDDGPPF